MPSLIASIAFIFAAYIIGSIPFAVIMSRLFRLPDPRTYGSKNPGATNVLRSGKKAAALLTLLGDGAKGWFAVLLAQHYAGTIPVDHRIVAAVALAVFLGHVFPIFLRFQGGKGVATFIGVAVALDGALGLGVMLTWAGAAVLFRYSSLAALISAVAAPGIALSLFGADARTLSMAIIAVLILWRHKKNIQNLRSGNEGKIGQEKNLR